MSILLPFDNSYSARENHSMLAGPNPRLMHYTARHELLTTYLEYGGLQAEFQGILGHLSITTP
jgi:hypothetical protein